MGPWVLINANWYYSGTNVAGNPNRYRYGPSRTHEPTKHHDTAVRIEGT